MKAKIIIPLVSVVAGSLMSACGGGGNSGPPVSQGPQPPALDTAEVLVSVYAKRRITSDKFLGQMQVPIKVGSKL